SIVPTRPLRASGSTMKEKRVAPTRLRDSTSATATDLPDRRIWGLARAPVRGFREGAYTLYGVGGCLKFISAVAAYSKEAKYNYVVFSKYEFIMTANTEVPEQNLRSDVALDIPDQIPQGTPCVRFARIIDTS